MSWSGAVYTWTCFIGHQSIPSGETHIYPDVCRYYFYLKEPADVYCTSVVRVNHQTRPVHYAYHICTNKKRKLIAKKCTHGNRKLNVIEQKNKIGALCSDVYSLILFKQVYSSFFLFFILFSTHSLHIHLTCVLTR